MQRRRNADPSILGIVGLEQLECRISDNDGGYSSGHTDSLSQLLRAVSLDSSNTRAYDSECWI